MAKVTTRVHFRFIQMPCCGYNFCCINPRIPNYCIECGRSVYPMLTAFHMDSVVISDDSAELHYDDGTPAPQEKPT